MNATTSDTTPDTTPDTTHPSRKEYATVQAMLARCGHQLIHDTHPLTGQSDYLINRWGWTRYFKAWPDVVAFAKQIGAHA